MVRGTVEETLNAMLDSEADRLCGAGRYERGKARPGSYERTLHTKAGDVSLNIRSCGDRPSRGDCFRQWESSVEEVLIEMCLAGYHGGAVGHAGEPEHGVEPEQEDLVNRCLRTGVSERIGSYLKNEQPYCLFMGFSRCF
jgi:hypothetical protein